MRLDTLGKSPQVLLAENAVQGRSSVVTIRKIPEAKPPADSGPSTGQEGEQARLGKIIDLLAKAKEREKQKRPLKDRAEALTAYQRHSAAESQYQSHVGQTLSIWV